MKLTFQSLADLRALASAMDESGLWERVTVNFGTLAVHCDDDATLDEVAALAAGLAINQTDEREYVPGEDMDGDTESALASAGLGTDEDYEHNLCDEY